MRGVGNATMTPIFGLKSQVGFLVNLTVAVILAFGDGTAMEEATEICFRGHVLGWTEA